MTFEQQKQLWDGVIIPEIGRIAGPYKGAPNYLDIVQDLSIIAAIVMKATIKGSNK